MRETQLHTSAWAPKDGYFYSYARSTNAYVSMGFLRRLFLLICEKHKRIRQHGLLKEVISAHMRETQVHTSAWASKGVYFYSYARSTSTYVSMGFFRRLFLLICKKHKYIRQHGLLKMVFSTRMRHAQAHTSAWASKGGISAHMRETQAHTSAWASKGGFSTHMRETQAHTSAWAYKGGYFLLICEKHKRIRHHGRLKEGFSTRMREAQAHTSGLAYEGGYFYSYARNTSAYVSTGV